MHTPVSLSHRIAPSGLTDFPAPAVVWQRVTALLFPEETDSSHHVSTLAGILKIDRGRVYRWRNEGIRNVEDISMICRAFSLPPSILLEPVIQGTQLVDSILRVDGVELQTRAWVSTRPLPPDKPSAMVCRSQEGRFWRLEPCSSGPRETAHAAFFVDSLCQPRHVDPQVAICLPGSPALSAKLAEYLRMFHCGVDVFDSGAELISALSCSPLKAVGKDLVAALTKQEATPTLGGHREALRLMEQYAIWSVKSEAELKEEYAQAPNVLILHDELEDWPSFVTRIRSLSRQYVPAIILSDQPMKPSVFDGYYYCSIMLPEIISMIRRVV